MAKRAKRSAKKASKSICGKVSKAVCAWRKHFRDAAKKCKKTRNYRACMKTALRK